ncbi:MAG: hypothetical protein GX649_18220, partial [Chloroflexi bacterium]|nr:hypothetical protein [Chloroflexota bacterium]
MAASGGMWTKVGGEAAARRVFLTKEQRAGAELASRGSPEALERWGGGAVSYDKTPHP